MRLAFSTLACPDWPLERVLDAAHTYGYEGIELRMLDGDLVSPALPGRRRAEVRDALAGSGVALCCLDMSFEIANPDEDVAEAIAAIELAADLGAPVIRLFGGAPAGEPFEITAERVTGRIDTLVGRGRDADVVVALETHDSFASGEAAARVLEHAPRDAGVVYDTLNAFVTGEPPESTIASVAGRLVHVHVKDGGREPDPERNLLYGDGAVPLAAIVAGLASIGYDGWLSVEWEKRWQPSIAEADVALPHYAAGLRAAIAALDADRRAPGAAPE
jgi:sugar phosphate isomerase/epimerase